MSHEYKSQLAPKVYILHYGRLPPNQYAIIIHLFIVNAVNSLRPSDAYMRH